jgi:S-adenosylmethionine:tRNA ribosyltransferase-isomerase
LKDTLTLADFDYHLPSELIAQAPAAKRTDSRLLHVDSAGLLHDRWFRDIVSLLHPGDLLVFNNTKVIKARLFGQKDTGGKVEVLIERITGLKTALAHVRASKTPRTGSVLQFAEGFEAIVTGREHDLYLLTMNHPVLDVLESKGQTPLPPYITHTPDEQDESRYQTVYAEKPGAVAAPTAGLHFDESILAQLQAFGVKLAFVTLHVGAGTFQPVRGNDLSQHVMHSEWYEVPVETERMIQQTHSRGGRVIAVGTTSVRALESAAQQHGGQALAGSSDTRLFITPGFQFQVIDAMVTNFHLPQSTLLMLVSAFIGLDKMREAYAHAVDQRYRFFSYGDAMFLERKSVA